MASLSGGNQQKVVLARVFSQKPKALVVSQPTRGVDVGATEYIHRQMLQMRHEGAAILLVSADLDEIRSLSDRIAVIYQGKLVIEKPAGEFTEEELGLWMAGMGQVESPKGRRPDDFNAGSTQDPPLKNRMKPHGGSSQVS